MNIKNKFLKFLLDNDAIIQYDDNTEYGYDKEINRILDIGAETGLINNAFTWTHTPEGHDYWDKLSDEWVQELKRMKLEGEL